MIPYKDLQRTRTFPIVTVLLLSANITLFLYQVLLPAAQSTDLISRYAVIPLEFKRGANLDWSPGPAPLLSLVTALFLHGGWFHLLGNMLYLWIFGDNVEDRMGRFRFLIFYLLCGILATVAQVWSDFDSPIPALGASGAIAGVLGAYLRFFPKARIVVLIPILITLRATILPAWLVLGGWVLLQIVQVRVSGASPAAGGIAYFAHLGGFAAGILFCPLFLKGRRRSR